MAGSAFRIYFSSYEKPSYLEMELMAGTTDNENIPFILVGRASFAFAFGKEKKAHWGFGIGGFYYDLSPQDRLLGEENSFETLYSAKIGYQF